jgi:PAS domain S-box-containing protein
MSRTPLPPSSSRADCAPRGCRARLFALVHRLPIFWRLMIFAVLVIVGVTGFSIYVAVQSMRSRLANELIAVVTSIAPLIDGDLHERIRGNARGEPTASQEFQRLRGQLAAVKAANQLSGPGSSIYTLRPAADYLQSGALEFVVMTDHDRDGRFFTGRRHPAHPHLRRALAGEPSYGDSEGTWISAAAPIRDRHGRVVAVVQADRTVGYFLRECRSQLVTLLIGGLLILTGGIFLAVALARAVQRPLQALVQATKSITEGRLETRVPALVRDEIGLLAQSFNEMAAELQASQARDQARAGEIQRMVDSVKASKNFFHSLVDSLPLYLFRKDLAGHYTFINAQACTRLDKTMEDILGLTDVDLAGPNLGAKWREIESAVLRDRTPVETEEAFVKPDGTSLYFHVIRSPVFTPDGDIVGIQGVVLDITARKQAEQELGLTQARLVEASRQAGMAEVAIGVLHNVGNVLNSVNVSAALVIERLRKSRIASLSRAVQLLREHEHNVGAFLAHDSKGRQLPAFLAVVTEELVQEQTTMSREMQCLQQHIDHIKQVVAMQQSYAGVAGVIEPLDLAELAEDALRLYAPKLAQAGVEVIKLFQEAPPVMADKHKILQVLVNLISNAHQSLAGLARPDKRLTLGIAWDGVGRVRLIVKDNGEGIAPENLARIFQHGFTTKKNGHGFGLHSGANTAREMGGSLQAQSDGPRTGATLILELPVSETVTPPGAPPADEGSKRDDQAVA